MSNSVPISRRQQRYLAAMDIPVWARRSEAKTEDASLDAGPESVMDVSGEEWQSLAANVADCAKCPLHQTRTHTVFGVGSTHARWLLVGEAPGAEEDRQGEPFVGRAGKLLNAMLRAVGLSRESVYIANILKCRPPNNRDPKPEEAATCQPYLDRQIELIGPGVILALGRIAAQNLLASSEPVGRLRGRTGYYRDTGIPVVVTYHPAYLLRSPLQKQRAWDDLKLARQMAGMRP
jgi:uracil-DNA glycosylase